MHQKVWFSKKNSEIDRILNYRKISKSESCVPFFSPTFCSVVSHVGHTIYPWTPTDSQGCPMNPQGTLHMVRKSFILFYMINYHEVIPFLVYISVSHSRRCKFYNSYSTYRVNSTSPYH